MLLPVTKQICALEVLRLQTAHDHKLVSLIDWISDILSQGYNNLQSLVKCLDHRGTASDTVCTSLLTASAGEVLLRISFRIWYTCTDIFIDVTRSMIDVFAC